MTLIRKYLMLENMLQKLLQGKNYRDRMQNT